MLNRANLTAAAATNKKPAAQPIWPSGSSPHLNERMAGATPKEITSANESNSTPKALVVPVILAIRPSSMSRTKAKPMKSAAVDSSPRIACTMQA
jgi:hypothetical protein